MAVLHKKEEKIQVVLGRLPKNYTQEEFVAMFIKLYSKDWGKIKSAYNKQAQDKEPGTIVNMPKPDLYLKQVLDLYLKQNAKVEPIKEKALANAKPKVESDAIKAPAKKTASIKPKDAETAISSDVTKKEKVSVKKKSATEVPLPTKTIKKEK